MLLKQLLHPHYEYLQVFLDLLLARAVPALAALSASLSLLSPSPADNMHTQIPSQDLQHTVKIGSAESHCMLLLGYSLGNIQPCQEEGCCNSVNEQATFRGTGVPQAPYINSGRNLIVPRYALREGLGQQWWPQLHPVVHVRLPEAEHRHQGCSCAIPWCHPPVPYHAKNKDNIA